MVDIEDIQPGAILRIREVGGSIDKLVRVLRYGRIVQTQHGEHTYVTLPGRRVRPADPSVSFGNDHYYTVRLSSIVLHTRGH